MADDTRAAKAPSKISDNPLARATRVRAFDRVMFAVAVLSALWLLVVLIVRTPHGLHWRSITTAIVLAVVLVYLVLPRVHRILTTIYVPDYFVGRTRTSEGLLGDPLNLAVCGGRDELATAMDRAGWKLADPVTARSTYRIIRSTLTGTPYPTAPASPLFLFGREQDATFQQEDGGDASKRHHVRFWKTPDDWPLPGGARVDWLAAGTYDKSVGLSLFTLQVTHKIDENIDVERDHVLKSVGDAVPDASVKWLEDFTTGYHSRNGGGDEIETDGNLPILHLGDVEPDPDAPTDWPVRTRSMPPQLWLPAGISLLALPFVIWFAWRSLPADDVARIATIATVAGSAAVAALGVATLFGSALARRVVSPLGALVGAAHVYALMIVDDRGDVRASHLLGALAAMVITVGLSSSKVSSWTDPEASA